MSGGQLLSGDASVRHGRGKQVATEYADDLVGATEFARRWATEQAHKAHGLAPIYDPHYCVARNSTGDGSVTGADQKGHSTG